jgi:hypothetical protein
MSTNAIFVPEWVAAEEDDELFGKALSLGFGDVNLPTAVETKHRCKAYVHSKGVYNIYLLCFLSFF